MVQEYDGVSVASLSGAPGARTVQFRAGGPQIPLDLVRARDAGEVVFVVGAGASRGSGLHSFEGLTRTVFQELAGADPGQPRTVPHAEYAAFKSSAYDVDRTQLEARLRRGPPLESWTQGTADQRRQWQRARAQRFLSVLAREGGPLLPESTEFVGEMTKGAGHDKTELTVDDLLAGGVHVRSVPEGDASKFANCESVDLVVALETAGDERDFGGSDHAAAFVRREPERTLEALLAAPDAFAAHGDLWRQLLWRLAEADWIERAPVEQKQRVLDAIGRLDGEALETTISSAVRWLEKCVVGRDEAVLPFLSAQQDAIIEVWHHLASRAFLSTAQPPENHFGANQGERLMQRAYNSAAGELTFVGLALLDKARRAPEQLNTSAQQAERIETAICEVTDRGRPDVAARLAEWAHIAAVLMPRATEHLVLGPITESESDAALCLLDLHAQYGRGLTSELYGRLEPIMVRESKRNRLSNKGVAHLVGRLTWRALDRLSGTQATGLSPPELRSVLQRTSDEGRRAAADTVRDWLKGKPLEERADAWVNTGRIFFAQCWAFDVALRSPELSQHLARIPALLGPAFRDGVTTIVPLLVPFEVWDVDTLFLYFGSRQQTDEGQEFASTSLRRKAAGAAWSAAVDLLDAALGPHPKVVPYDLAEWLTDLRSYSHEAQEDPRFKRLLRLTQR